MTTLVMIALFFAGVTCYNQLSVSNLPEIEYPSINVQVTYPGVTPTTMANFIALPLEQQFMTIAGVKSVTSSSTVGKTTIVLTFDVTKNVDNAAQDVQSAINAAQSNLPPNLPQSPIYRKVNPADAPIAYVVLVSDTMPQWDLYEYANTYVGQRISMIDGVAQVTNYASPYAVRTQVDPFLLSAKGITLAEVANTLAESNPNVPTGQLNSPERYSIIQVNGQLDKAYLYDPIIINYVNGAPVRIQDIGHSVDGVQTDTINGLFTNNNHTQAVVTLAIQRQPGANIIKVSDAIAEELPKIIPGIPASVQLIKVYDRAETVRESIAEVKLTLLIAFLLVMTVIFIYLGKIRDTIIPSVAMPMSIVITFIAMFFLNYTIDNLSLLAFTVAVGFIVDDAIVVLENIVRHVENGEKPIDAALMGSKQISFTILSMTLSLVAVFIPIVFMPGLIGKIFKEFSVTLMVVTLASGFISLTLTPMLCSRFIPPKSTKQKEKKNSSERFNDYLVSYYRPALIKVIAHAPYSLVVAVLCIVLTIYFFRVLPQDFIPDDDVGYILGYIQAEQGTSSYEMLNYQQQIIEVLEDDPNINNLVTIMGNPDVRQGVMNLRLKPYNQRKGIVEVMQELNAKLKKIPGLNIYLKNIPLINLSIGYLVRGSYQYSLQSLEPDRLYTSADNLYNRMVSDPVFQSVSTDLEIKTPQINVSIDRDKASSYGISVKDIENVYAYGYSQNLVSRIETALDQYNVILELAKPDQYYTSSFHKIYLENTTPTGDISVGFNAPNTYNSGFNNPLNFYTQTSPGVTLTNSSGFSVVPLNEVVNYVETVGPASINHISQFPSVTITFNLAPGVPLSTALERLDKLAKETVENRVTGSFQGAALTFQDSIRGSAYLLIFSIICIYIVLGILYESFIHPLTILSTLPPAIVGGLFTLYIFNVSLSAYAYLGIILLIGIVKKNGIMMVDYALDNIRTKGESAEKSIIDAAVVRFRPIMMTTLSAVIGSVPIAVGLGITAQARRPLGFVIIGGLLFSQMITLFITPVIYLYMERLREYYGVHEQKIDLKNSKQL
jgi:HAE1 family hydrophobic/amphiphilic exporter-1